MKVKRPLFIISISILVVIYAINTMPGSTVLYSLALFALFIFFHWKTKNKHTIAMLLSLTAIVIGGLYFDFFNTDLQNKIKTYADMGELTITGQLTERGGSSTIARIVTKVDTVNGEKVNNLSLVSYTNDILQPGMNVKLTGKVKSFTPTSNYLSYYSDGIFADFNISKLEVSENNNTFTSYFYTIKNKLINTSRKIFDYKAVPLTVAMGLGDKSLMDTHTVKLFSFIGLSHALVVSGLHVGFIVLSITFLLHFIPVKKKIKNIVTLVLVFLFMGIVGFTPSVIRAGLLVICMLLGRNLVLETDNYTILGIIILVSLIINPYSALNPSLLLSYFAYFGVVKAGEICVSNKYGKIKTAFMVSSFALLYTSPIMAVLNMELTLLSPIFNFALSLIVAAICVLSFFLPVIYHIPLLGKIIVFLLAPVNEFLIGVFLKTAEFGQSKLSFAMVNLGTEQMIFTAFVSAAVICMLIVQAENTNFRKILILSVPVLSLLCYNYLNRDIVNLKVFDGSSQPNYIISYKNKDYLVASENINEITLTDFLKYEKADYFDEIIICSEKSANTDLYSQYTDKITAIDKSGIYKNDIFSVESDIKNRKMAFVVDISGFRTGFNHNKADLSQYNLDTYFFGKDCPQAVDADNCYYFYPVIKANKSMAMQKNAKELYDTINIKINIKTGEYFIIKDVKNFGGQLQNYR